MFWGYQEEQKNDIIKDMHNNMSEEKREIRKKKWQAYRTGRPVKEETKIKIGNGNRGKYRGGGTGKIVSPLKGQTKETNAALRRMSEERKNKSFWTPEAWEKRLNTLRKNNTFNTSKAEQEIYNYLITLYSPTDIKTNYNQDPRYPFHCDFYIISQDLFIELNLHFSHGPHPFDPNNEEDLKLLEKWKEKAKASKYYEVAIDVWTRRDINKFNIAKKNNLKYKTIYQKEYKANYRNKY